TIARKPLSGPAAWRGSELEAADYVYELDARELEVLARLRSDLVDQGIGLGAIDPESTPLPGLADTVADWLTRLEHGIGFVVIRGLDIEGWTEREVGLVYYALGRQMGSPVKQNDRGHLLAHVRDTGKDIRTDPSARGYQVRVALPFHTDTSTDLLALMCRRSAKSGGDSALAPLHTIYNEVLARRPDLIETFYEPFNFDCRDEEHPDGGPFYTRVLASVGTDGQLSLRHNSGYIRSAARRLRDRPLAHRVRGLGGRRPQAPPDAPLAGALRRPATGSGLRQPLRTEDDRRHPRGRPRSRLNPATRTNRDHMTEAQRRVALIANTSLYIGAPLAREMARRGHDLVIGDPEQGLVDELEALGATVAVAERVWDVADPDVAERLVGTGLDRFGRIDAATAFTGHIVTGRFLDSTTDDLHALERGLIDAPYQFMKAVLPSMIEQGEGQILMITSSAGNRVLPSAPLYSALRAGATHLVKNVAADVASKGVQVNALGTNFMDFDGFIAANKADTPEGLAKTVARVPMGRLGTVDECAALCCAYLDGTCGFVTGQFIAHDGGWS
ncbi:MAG: SDR family oxidoreductase, partial [Ilumatobacter sp.]